VMVVLFGLAFADGGIIQMPAVAICLPQTIVFSRCVMVQPIMVNSTVQPALQSLVTDSNKCDASPDMMWSCRAFCGRCGISRLHVCVDVTISPFGICTIKEFNASRMSMTGASVTRKWFVAPKSKVSQFSRSSTLISTVCSKDCAAYAYCDIPYVGM